ncbi:MAG: hypothetical protein AAF700_06090 [Pseudomonadota bacterium]
MTDDLERKLTDLTEPAQVKDGAMVLGVAGSEATSAAMLRSIDNTILPSRIDLSVGGSSISLAAGGRRLRACTDASTDLGAPAEVLGKTLSLEEEKPLREVGKLINELLRKDGMLTMKRHVEPAASGQSDAGVGVKTLADSWGVDLDAVPPTKFELFENALGETFIASIETDGAARIGGRGDEATADRLERDVLPKLIQLEADLSRVKTERALPYLMTINSALPDGAFVSLFVADGAKSLVASKAGSLPRVAGAWGQL